MNTISDKPEDRRDSKKLPRRGFIGGLMSFSIAATVLGILTPITGYLWPSRRSAEVLTERTLVGTVNDYPVNIGVVLPVASKPVVITHPVDMEMQAFSAICTHLGCVARWHASGGYIQCPCHDGRFNALTGAVISGPPPRPLTRYRIIIEDDNAMSGSHRSRSTKDS